MTGTAPWPNDALAIVINNRKKLNTYVGKVLRIIDKSQHNGRRLFGLNILGGMQARVLKNVVLVQLAAGGPPRPNMSLAHDASKHIRQLRIIAKQNIYNVTDPFHMPDTTVWR